VYGDTGVMRRRVAELREQAADVRTGADRLVARMDGLTWSGRAAEAMRDHVRQRASALREVSAAHDTAADSLERHLHEVDTTKDAIADAERRVRALVAVRPTEFEPPPPGHRDWLDIDLPDHSVAGQ
jgi:hypothetical protein